MDLLRTEEELKQQVGELARVYTPEWEFPEENPDAGSVIALIFAEQMGKRLEVMDGVLERYRFNLANTLGLTLRPVVPTEGVIAMEVVRGVDDSVPVPAGSKFLAGRNDERLIVFETRETLSVSPVSLTEIVGIKKASGKVIPWRGDWKPVDIPGVSPDVGDARQKEIWLRGRLFCFRNFNNRPGETLHLETGIKELIGDMGSYEFQFYTDDGFLKCVPSGMCGDTVEFQQEIPWRKLKYEGEVYRVILIRRLYPADRAVIAQGIGFVAAGTVEPAEFRSYGEEELTREHFYPFGKRINLYKEFYIGSSSQLERAGARITISFRLSYEERDYSCDGAGENFELRPIRKKPRGEWK